MEEIYRYDPKDYVEIEDYVSTDAREAIKAILLTKKCYFYDTCAFRRHAKLKRPGPLLDFLKEDNGIVIILISVLIELCNTEGSLPDEAIVYFDRMKEKGLPVYLLREESMGEILHLYCWDTEKLREWLRLSVAVVKGPLGALEHTLKQVPSLQRSLFSDMEANHNGSRLYHDLFWKVIRNKAPDDNLGEEMIGVSIHLLSHLPQRTEYKYIVLTEDKGAVGSMNMIFDNIRQHCGILIGTVLTSPRIAQLLLENGYMTDREDLIQFLQTGLPNPNIRVFGLKPYDLRPEFIPMTCEELAESMVKKSIRVCY